MAHNAARPGFHWAALILAALVPGCAPGTMAENGGVANEESRNDGGPAMSWTIELTSEGGIAGKGNGGVTLQTSGDATAQTLSRSCKGAATDQELQKARELVSTVQMASWKERYALPNNPNGCCDQFTYTLKLTTRAGTPEQRSYSTSWFEEASNILPTDAGALRDLLVGLRDRLIENCR